MPRNRRLDQALGTSKRSVRIATGLILLMGAVILFWFFSPGEKSRRDRVERLELGDSSERVAALLGQPPARCPAGDLSHLRESFPPRVARGVAGDGAADARSGDLRALGLSPRRRRARRLRG